ncbi:hypothetical protein FQR65_LT13341 [Abscondita terminalis]|nr:hypothetical protein FQR65_LT13341 [Abscondita terminalis]
MRTGVKMPRKIIFISDEIKTASAPIMHVGRIWGLFPMVMQKRESYLVLKWSPKFFFYSAVLGAVLVIMTVVGMINDLEAGSTKSIRMKQRTGKYVTIVDISVVALIVFIGVFGTPFRLVDFFSYLDCLNEVDSIILVSDAKKARKVCIIRLFVVIAAITVILASDLAMWWTIGDRSQESDFLIGNYIPFYISYYVILLLECQYWHMVYCIERRLKLLNGCLKINGFSTDDVVNNIVNKPFSLFRNGKKTPKQVVNVIDAIGKQQSIADVFFVKNVSKLKDMTTNDYVIKLTRAYLKLCEAADYVNQCCGLIVLVGNFQKLSHDPDANAIFSDHLNQLPPSPGRDAVFPHLRNNRKKKSTFCDVAIRMAFDTSRASHHHRRRLLRVHFRREEDKTARLQIVVLRFRAAYQKTTRTFCHRTESSSNRIYRLRIGQDRSNFNHFGAVTTYLVILIQFQKYDS